MIIEIVNQETVIDVNGETFTAEVLVTNYSDELIARYALEAQEAAQEAEVSAQEAEANATIATNQAIIATNQALLASAARLNAQNAANAAEASEDAAALSAAAALASEQASAISESNASISASNALASEDAADLDAIATAADRVQTGLDRIATAADRVQTGIDANTATVQAGIATTQAGNALTSANNAAVSASTAASAALNTPLTGFASGANTTILSTDTTLQAFGKTQGQVNARVSGIGANGQVSFWNSLNTITSSPKFTFNGTSLGLSMAGSLDAININIENTNAYGSVGFYNNLGVQAGSFGYGGSTVSGVIGRDRVFFSTLGKDLLFSVNQTSTAHVLIKSVSGNVLINTTTDAGFRLDVNGTARVQGSLSVVHNNDNFTFGATIRNNSTLTNALTGINLNNNGTSVGQFVYAASNYVDPSIQNTVLFSSVGLQKLAFVANASNSGVSVGSDIYFKTRANNTNNAIIIFGNSQNVTINSNTDIASAILNVNSTTKGFLPPRMTSAQRDAIATPETGLMVYNTTDNRPSFYNGTTWINL
jgi:hypothetical protein